MELALYCPVIGYYEKEEDTLGHTGDYYTSVSVGPLFGELLARQFAQWLKDVSGPVQLVEGGAHRAQLAHDVLRWFRSNRPELFARLEYLLVEPSARRREWQRRTLAEFPQRVRWVEVLPGQSDVFAIIFSNELFDSMPVHRLGWDAEQRAWFEWAVTIQDGHFAWTRTQPDEQLVELAREQVDSSGAFPEWLPAGFIFDVCPEAEKWWGDAAGALSRGKLLTFDYGLSSNELLMPERRAGTLRAYYRHRVSDDLLANPGEQDITAHVNFGALESEGKAAGLITELFTTQARFLTSIAAGLWKNEGCENWTPEQTRQFQTLTHPEHLGEKFRVLIQARA